MTTDGPDDVWAAPADEPAAQPRRSAPPGQPGYPAHPGYPNYPGYPGYGGVSDVRPGTNGLAITSLVTGVICCCWPAAIGFGIGALVQLRRRRQAGRGLAVAGLVLGLIGALLTALLAVEVVRHAQPETSVFKLRVGACFQQAPSPIQQMVTTVPCTSPHYGEVSGTVNLTDPAFPGAVAARRETDQDCGNTEDTYILDPWARPATLREYHLAPADQLDWDQGGHIGVCFLTDTAPDPVPRPLRADGVTLTPDQFQFVSGIDDLDLDRTAPADRARIARTARDLPMLLISFSGRFSAGIQPQITAFDQELTQDVPLWQAAAADPTTPVADLYARLAGHDGTASEIALRRTLGLVDQPPAGNGSSADGV